ncbi:hypothetical protein NDU88_000659 [Pleurodeles waltl]|uniref:Uncharacterized protein n=2 Tax=Pleurodeles waltl TaxID=8319 RepID=A0AAV7KND5_PLEWA|nr:hypothetical protein NDU88_000659 [Pleurodeles waltl]
MFAGSSRGSSSRAGKYSVEELYGLTSSKKPRGGGGRLEVKRKSQQLSVERREENGGIGGGNLFSAARRLMDRRKLEIYLQQSGLSFEETVAEQTGMVYR